MERVVGIGGVFFKARDPKVLAQWYADHLGLEVQAAEGGFAMLTAEAGDVTVWSVFPESTKYFDPGTKPFMLNYRVRNLDAMLAQLREAGVTVDDRVQDEGYGRFGWAIDPEGNRIELWEPTES